MSRSRNFIELEGHVIRIANIVRVSIERYVERKVVKSGSDLYLEQFGKSIAEIEREEEKEKEKKKLAIIAGQGSWLENDVLNHGVYGKVKCIKRATIVTEYYVRLRGSRDIVLHNQSSYEKLKEAMGL